MANWVLKIDIKKEIKALKDFSENFSQDYEFSGENEDKYFELVKDLENKIKSYEEIIKKVTENDGTFEDLEHELEDLFFSINLDNANYCMENIYQICDVAGIWLIQQ